MLNIVRQSPIYLLPNEYSIVLSDSRLNHKYESQIEHQWILKILLLIILAVFSITEASAQVLMVDKAYELLKEGQLERSREAIEAAVQHPSTNIDARTWYLRSFIYKESITELTAEHAFQNISLESAIKCLELDKESRFSEDCRAIINYIFTGFQNEAIASLNNQDYKNVLFALKPIVAQGDQYNYPFHADALFYYGYALLQLGEENDAQKYLFQSLQSGYQDPLIYEIEAAHRLHTSQTDSARWYLDKGRQLFPDDANLHIAELNFLMQLKDYSTAEKSIQSYLKNYPDNIEGLLLAGTVYENLFSLNREMEVYFQEQVNVYQQILSLRPNHLQANYNLGIAYYNRAVKLINSAANNYDLDITDFNHLLEQCSSLFLKALPHIEKVSSLDQEHINALKALEGIYYNINDYEQYNLVKAKLEKL
uniref:Tetratricopeptide repeat protein n=1 Tax=Roseihalotalea indica TaxID=2867963 RepID=A0AA49GRY8_9BACT|nr:hypothetical protein K4G66_27825 [Tunicatimonas sp. TK19036]